MNREINFKQIDLQFNYGKNLEIISRGFRNPWDICFDDEFNWLGTDNDQTAGDKIFAPFFGAHFGWDKDDNNRSGELWK